MAEFNAVFCKWLNRIEFGFRTKKDKANEHLLTGAYRDVRDRNKAKNNAVFTKRLHRTVFGFRSEQVKARRTSIPIAA